MKCSCLFEKAKHLHGSLFAANFKFRNCSCVLINVKLRIAEVDLDRPDSNSVRKSLRPISKTHIHIIFK